MTSIFRKIFADSKPLIGMIHLDALPGSPAPSAFDATMERARRDCATLVEAGFDGVLVENFGDVPFIPGRVGPETTAAMALVIAAIVDESPVPVGVNVLRNDALTAMGLAHVCGGMFIRVNVLAGAVVTDQGVIQGKAHELMRYRSSLGGNRIAVLADVMVKHSSPLGAADPGQAAADLVERAGADAVIVTGQATGAPIDEKTLGKIAGAAKGRPVIAGSGVTPEFLPVLAPYCDGYIVGSWLKEDGDPRNRIDPARAEKLVKTYSEHR